MFVVCLGIAAEDQTEDCRVACTLDYKPVCACNCDPSIGCMTFGSSCALSAYNKCQKGPGQYTISVIRLLNTWIPSHASSYRFDVYGPRMSNFRHVVEILFHQTMLDSLYIMFHSPSFHSLILSFHSSIDFFLLFFGV